MQSLVKQLAVLGVVAINVFVSAEAVDTGSLSYGTVDHAATAASIIGHRDVAPLDPVAVETVTKRWLGNPPDVVESLSTTRNP